MGICRKILSLSNSEYTARFQRLCGIYSREKKHGKCESDLAEEPISNITEGTNAQKRNGYRQCGTECDNNNTELVGKNNDTKVKRQNSEIDHLWRYLTFTQKCIFYILNFSSSLGNEVFYLLFYPYVAWNLDSVVVRRTSVVWCICMYVGQALKDYLRWPRPLSPPVVRLETDYMQEFGMPSTHAMSATAIPFMLAFTIISRYEISPVLVVSIAVAWCLLVCSSRLYLGVHSVLDILAGVIISFFIILLMVPHMKEFDMFQQSHPVAPLVILGISLALSTVCYPDASKDHSTRYSTRGDAVQIVSIIAGVTLGTWINYQYGITIDKGQQFQAQIVFPTVTMITESFLRFVIGILILGAIYVIFKQVSIRFFSFLYQLEKPDKRHPSVEIAYKFCTYYVMGVAIIFLVPYSHFLLGLGRTAYFNEVQ